MIKTRLIATIIILLCSLQASAGQKPRHRVTLMTTQLAKQIVSTARSYGLEPQIVLEIMRRESAFNPRAKSYVGAVGLMQLMPATAARFGIYNPYDPQQAITGGCRYLVYLMERFNGRLDLVLAGYNAGEEAVVRSGMKVPPYPETQNYVRSVLIGYERARKIVAGKTSFISRKAERPLSKKEIRTRLIALDRWLPKRID